jgi:hypothetical protein
MFPGGTEEQARTVAEELGQSNIDPRRRWLLPAGRQSCRLHAFNRHH